MHESEYVALMLPLTYWLTVPLFEVPCPPSLSVHEYVVGVGWDPEDGADILVVLLELVDVLEEEEVFVALAGQVHFWLEHFALPLVHESDPQSASCKQHDPRNNCHSSHSSDPFLQIPACPLSFVFIE